MSLTHEINDFQIDVLERSRQVPVLVDFWAEWCGPCRLLGPVLERLAAEAGGRWALAKVDTEAHPDLAMRYDIRSIPNCKLFVNGDVVDEFVGALPEPALRRWLEQAIPSPLRSTMLEGAALLEAGRFYEAATRLRDVAEADPANAAARVLLARALLHLDPSTVEEALRGVGEDADEAERAEALRALAALAARAERPETLPAGPARAHLLAAARAVRAADWDAALAALIEAMRAQRDAGDGAARDAGRAIFRLLGIEHPACERHHRAFAAALNV
jgi:putative thioredoxin